MSELKLSTDLVDKLEAILVEHDESATDPGVASQYLCAVVGFLLGQQDMPAERKNSLHEQLSAFMLHVMEDVESQRAQAAPQAAPPVRQGSPADAFGIWKPGMS